ncbi:ABC transporter ATP-binding protein [Thermincola ferriacetica]
MTGKKEVLRVHNLKINLKRERRSYPLVKGVDFSLYEGETVALVGESGSGKSLTALSIMGLLPKPPLEIESGEILFDGRDLNKLSETEMEKIRGDKISMIFQEPMTALNPVFTVGEQIAEVLRYHRNYDKKGALAEAEKLLAHVGIPEPAKRAASYPHQLSGGMRQRAMIAMALACSPRILIADEPTTALDVTIQAQILKLLLDLKKEYGTTILLITHDLGVVAQAAQRTMVMYLGKILENALTDELFKKPIHPYTQGLLNSIPRIAAQKGPLTVIPGFVPNPWEIQQGCGFAPRCPKASERCFKEIPPYKEYGEGHWAACWEA